MSTVYLQLCTRLHYALPMFCTVYFKDNLCTEESKILYVNKKSVFKEQRSILSKIMKNFSNKKYRRISFTKKACGHELRETECQVIKVTYLSRKKNGKTKKKGKGKGKK